MTARELADLLLQFPDAQVAVSMHSEEGWLLFEVQRLDEGFAPESIAIEIGTKISD